MPSIRKSSWQQCFNLLNLQYLVYAYILCATNCFATLLGSPLCEPTCLFCDWQEPDISVFSKRKKHWEDRSKISAAD